MFRGILPKTRVLKTSCPTHAEGREGQPPSSPPTPLFKAPLCGVRAPLYGARGPLDSSQETWKQSRHPNRPFHSVVAIRPERGFGTDPRCIPAISCGLLQGPLLAFSGAVAGQPVSKKISKKIAHFHAEPLGGIQFLSRRSCTHNRSRLGSDAKPPRSRPAFRKSQQHCDCTCNRLRFQTAAFPSVLMHSTTSSSALARQEACAHEPKEGGARNSLIKEKTSNP